VQPGAGHLADGQQPRNGSLAAQIGADPAADVMGGRHHRDGHLRHVDPERQTGRVDVRKVLDHECLPQVRHVEERAVVAPPLELGIDAARHHVARGQLAARVVAFHEPLARGVAQDPSLATQRF